MDARSYHHQPVQAHPLPHLPPGSQYTHTPSSSSFQSSHHTPLQPDPTQYQYQQHDDYEHPGYSPTHYQHQPALLPSGRPQILAHSQKTEQPRTSAPRQQPPPPQRQPSRSKPRSFSFRSNASGGSKSDHHSESPAAKEQTRLTSKADPSLAINEAEPATVAAMRGGSIHSPLRSMKHKDAFGNLIEDPDRSNPTRSRWERPLDTIRAFEEAIDGEYNRRSLYMRPGTGVFNRESYYSQRNSFRPASTQFEIGAYPATTRTSYYGDLSHHNGNQPTAWGSENQSNRPRISRLVTEPGPSSNQRISRDPRDLQGPGVYPLQHNDRSYETVTSAAGSGSSEQAGYLTDPTSASDQSSIERTSPGKLPESAQINTYGIGFSHSPSFPQSQLRLQYPTEVATGKLPVSGPILSSQYTQPAPSQDIVPPLMPSHGSSPISPIKEEPLPVQKRMSWLRRRLSKRNSSASVIAT